MNPALLYPPRTAPHDTSRNVQQALDTDQQLGTSQLWEWPSVSTVIPRTRDLGTTMSMSPKKVGDDIAKGTKQWEGIRVTVRLTIQNRAAKVAVEPNATSLVIEDLKEPLGDRKKTMNIKHSGNLTKEQFVGVVKQMRFKSLAKQSKGTVKEILGACRAVGCTVDGEAPQALQQTIDDDEFEIPEK